MSSGCAAGSAGLSRRDFLSSTEPRWCPGCGDYSVFKALTTVFAELGRPREQYLVVSGIGCSSRLPYYAETYGFHSIHGRAPTVALGAKLANPDLSVWVITGDGDALSIGGNHFMHTIRRNPDLKIILFNNQIYGLTKGQASPTSPSGLKTKSTPFGALDSPVRPMTLAIASGATFAARVLDNDGAMLREVMLAAGQHQGISVIEVLVNCVIFNDGVFSAFTDKQASADTTVRLRHGEPLIFGRERNKGLVMAGASPRVAILGENGIGEADILRHDVSAPDSALAYMLASLEHPDFPLPIGILRQVTSRSYEDAVRLQEESITSGRQRPGLDEILQAGDTWTQ